MRTMLWTWLAGCGLGTKDEAVEVSRAACEACDETELDYCAADGQCVPEGDSGCAWGLVSFSDCSETERFVRTSLPVDCRDYRFEADPRCMLTYELEPGAFGTGVNVSGYDLGGGFVSGGELAIAYGNLDQDESGVLAVDLATGDRRLVSGRIDDALQGIQTRGDGFGMNSVDDVQLSPDGDWMVLDTIAGASIVLRIDPETGDRSVEVDVPQMTGALHPLCEIDGYGLDLGASVSSSSRTGAANLVLDDGTIYLRASRGGTPQEDLGLQGMVAIRDGSCEVVTAYSDERPAGLGVGEGPQVPDYYAWLVQRGERLLSVTSFFWLHEVNPETGGRTVLSSSDPSGPLGEGPDIGNDFATLSADEQSLWTNGGVGGGLIRVDLETGDRVFVPALAGPYARSQPGPISLHPDLEGVLIIAAQPGLVLFEPETGNSNVLSR